MSTVLTSIAAHSVKVSVEMSTVLPSITAQSVAAGVEPQSGASKSAIAEYALDEETSGSTLCPCRVGPH